jgi:hypothetical protein
LNPADLATCFSLEEQPIPTWWNWPSFLLQSEDHPKFTKKNYDDSKEANILIQHLVGWLKPIF